MTSYLEQLKQHKRVQDISVEDDGDVILVMLKEPWARYETGRKDGHVKGFDVQEFDPPLTQVQNAKRALNWVNNEVFEDKSHG